MNVVAKALSEYKKIKNIEKNQKKKHLFNEWHERTNKKIHQFSDFQTQRSEQKIVNKNYTTFAKFVKQERKFVWKMCEWKSVNKIVNKKCKKI